MSPSVHRADKKQFILRMDKQYRDYLRKLMEQGKDPNMTELLKRLLKEEAERKGIQ